MKPFRRIATGVCSILLLILPCAIRAHAAAPRSPAFTLPSVPEKKTVDLRDFRGKVVLVTFWATWCGPCVQEIPALISLQEKFGPQGFSVVGISLDQGGPTVVEKLMKRTGVNYLVVMGNEQVSDEFGGIFGIPTSFLLDREGKVLKRFTGWVSHEILAKEIAQAVE